MPLGSRSSLGAVAGVAVALALPVAAMACTPDEYLTAEERASGLYDTTPPDYYAGSDAPHTHGDVGAPAPAEAAPQTDGGGEPQAVAPAKPPERDARRAPGVGGGEAPAPTVVTPVIAPAVSEPAPTASAPAAAPPASAIDGAAIAEARAQERAARAEAMAQAKAARAAERQKARIALRVQRPPVRATASRPAAVAAAPRPATVPSDTAWQWLPLAAGLAGLLAGIGVLMGRRRRPDAVQAPDGMDPIEAELQAILAEENARRSAPADTPAAPDHSRI